LAAGISTVWIRSASIRRSSGVVGAPEVKYFKICHLQVEIGRERLKRRVDGPGTRRGRAQPR
jgi:hypothetical protein